MGALLAKLKITFLKDAMVVFGKREKGTLTVDITKFCTLEFGSFCWIGTENV